MTLKYAYEKFLFWVFKGKAKLHSTTMRTAPKFDGNSSSLYTITFFVHKIWTGKGLVSTWQEQGSTVDISLNCRKQVRK